MQNKNWQHNQNYPNKFNAKGKERKEQFPACKYYHKTNHLESWCWLKNAQCRRCKQIGYIKKFYKTNTSIGNQAYIVKTPQVEDEILFMATIEQKCSKTEVKISNWLVDSGCTNHMSANVKMFKTLDSNHSKSCKRAVCGCKRKRGC